MFRFYFLMIRRPPRSTRTCPLYPSTATFRSIPPPPRRDGGYRDSSEPDVHRLRFIANARDLGFPIEEIGKLLDLWADGKRASSEVKALAETRAAEIGRQAQARKRVV